MIILRDIIKNAMFGTPIWLMALATIVFLSRIIFRLDPDAESILTAIINTGYGLILIFWSATSTGIMLGQWYFWLHKSSD
jgi:hypothetical protein